MIEHIFEKHMNDFRHGCHKASLDSFIETGRISGSLLLAMRNMAQDIIQFDYELNRRTSNSDSIFPDDAHSFEVFAIKQGTAFIGYKLATGCFHYKQVPYTGGEF